MKGLKLPRYTSEQENEMWNSLNQGDKIAEIEWNYWRSGYYIAIHTILKRTPKGNLRLENGELIKSFENRYYVINDDIKCFIYNNKLEEDIMELLYNIDRDKKKFKENLTVEYALELKDLLSKIMSE